MYENPLWVHLKYRCCHQLINLSRTSTMEFIDIWPSPEMGAWLSEEFEQDFCYGAKASTYQNPVFATPPGSWALDDLNNTSSWTEQTKNLNELCHQEPFPDVILHDNFYIGPDDLLGEGLSSERSAEEYDDHKFYGLPTETLADSPIFELSPLPPESPQSQKLPTIKIKLKRVKRPKASKDYRQIKVNLKKLKFEIVAPPTCIEQNEIQSKKELCCPSNFPVVNDNPFNEVENQIFPNEDFQQESITNSPTISLRDAFDTGEADDFLDELLNGTKIVDSSEFENDLVENFIELDSSPLSSCSFVPSPHFDYSDVEMSPSSLETIDESLLSPSKEMFNFLEIGTSKPSKNVLTKKRPKKQPDESRYLRKKEQNKQAALRYRMKKKQEDTSLSDTLKQEEEHKEKLKMEFSNLKQEIHIMKNLLREAFVVKKLVPENFFSKNNG